MTKKSKSPVMIKKQRYLLSPSFHQPAPNSTHIPDNYEYPEPLPDPASITREQVRNILKLAPYKASSPDEIPNVVLQKASPLILEHLFYIFQATLDLGVYYKDWKIFTTVVLRKPGKPNYGVAKAY